LSATSLAEARNTLVIRDQRTLKLDRCRNQKTIRRVAVLEMVQLIGGGSGPIAQGYRLDARALQETVEPCLNR